jgi:peptidyl-prolyl cis-trans isomerase B (cyclophilin B)
MVKAVVTLEDGRAMTFELFPERAPITVASFAQSANEGFYDGLGVCRIVEGYVIQSGSPDGDIMTDSDFHIRGEFAQNGADTGLDHRRGAISMARDEAPDTAGTQFFVVHRDAHKLDGRYAAFGYMLEGFGVLDELAALPTSGPETWNKPLAMPVLRSVRVVTDGETLPPVQRMP